MAFYMPSVLMPQAIIRDKMLPSFRVRRVLKAGNAHVASAVGKKLVLILIAPLSPSLHLGADKLMIIGNRKEDEESPLRIDQNVSPSFAEIASHVLNSIFLDSLEADLERLTRINKTVSNIPDHAIIEHNIPLRNVDTLMISPSEDIGKLAAPYASDMPPAIRLLLRGIGAMRTEGSSLMSYLLFEKSYCRDLIELGYEDTLAKKEEIKDFLML